MMPNFFIGPMSKNIVDSIVEFCNETNNTIGLIPSRRQIEWNGGYVNNWTTNEFCKYVKSKSNNIMLVRDHSGPGQGQINDDGYESLKEDCNYFDVIHIDPWKSYPMFSEGMEETIKMIEYCYSLNPNIQYEIGTEESIRKFDTYELNDLIHRLKYGLSSNIFKQIKYLVIQSGTSLQGTNQTGHYNQDRLKEMLEICKRNDLISKEHNGDYIPVSIINKKFSLGLDSINIAPEFGLIETQTYLDSITDTNMFETFFQICYKSGKWHKWVDKNFDAFSNKKELIKICGHYIFAYPEFISSIKSKMPNIDEKIKINITTKLNILYGRSTS